MQSRLRKYTRKVVDFSMTFFCLFCKYFLYTVAIAGFIFELKDLYNAVFVRSDVNEVARGLGVGAALAIIAILGHEVLNFDYIKINSDSSNVKRNNSLLS